jgi:hypothetical protein
VFVTTLQFTIPASDYPVTFGCGALITPAPRELNGEVYGDWAFEIGPGGQMAGATATAVVTYIDDAGVQATSTIRGAVVAGSGPETYTGGQNGGACFHGYGSTG